MTKRHTIHNQEEKDFILANGVMISYPENPEITYFCHSEMAFAFVDGEQVDIPDHKNHEAIVQHAIIMKQLKHIVRSLKTDLDSGILKTRIQGDDFLILEKELKMFNRKQTPQEYHLDVFIEKPDYVLSFEGTEQLFYRYKKYLGITILR